MFGGVQTISLSSATTFTLSTPSGSLTPGAGPNQSQNALLKFTGTLSGNALITFTIPGRYVLHNNCTVGAFVIQCVPSGGGNRICAPPGQKVTVFYDGTDMDFVDMPMVAERVDLHGPLSLPAWMVSCTVKPYLIRDGTVYNMSAYTALGAALGSTFGGNGSTTFGVPDSLNRLDLPVDTAGAGRVTSAGSGISGATMGASGGSQLMQQHTHTTNDPGHTHASNAVANTGAGAVQGGSTAGFAAATITPNTTGITINNAGTGTAQNMIPCLVSILPLIKT